MSTGPEDHLVQAVSMLCEPLHSCFEQGGRKASVVRRRHGLEGRQYEWLGTHLTRGIAHRQLASAVPEGWKVVGNHARNGEVWLAQGRMTLRVLHTWSEVDVPAPGANAARQAYYTNPPLPGMEEEHQLALLGVSRLLALWRVVASDPLQVGIRLVRTTGAWKFKQKAKLDIDVVLPRLGEDFLGLSWSPNSEGLEITIPADEEQEREEGDSAE